nr:hypothetical protein GCM10020063_033300 [Dactylosporangium thailandense]
MRAVVVAALLLTLTGCARSAADPAARPPSAAAPAVQSPSAAGDWPAGVKEAEVYTAVLHRYLATRSENSISENGFATTYVLDHDADGAAIADNTQHQVTVALSDVTTVHFIADRESVLTHSNGCAMVKDGGILITLGRPDGDDNEVRVRVHGFVACLGATRLTYVVENSPGPGWTVTGTTGSFEVA